MYAGVAYQEFCCALVLLPDRYHDNNIAKLVTFGDGAIGEEVYRPDPLKI